MSRHHLFPSYANSPRRNLSTDNYDEALFTTPDNQFSIQWQLLPNFPNCHDASPEEKEHFTKLNEYREIAHRQAKTDFKAIENEIHCIRDTCLRTGDLGTLTAEQFSRLTNQLVNIACFHTNARTSKKYIFDKMPPTMKGFCDEAAYFLIQTILAFQIRKRLTFPLHLFRFREPTLQPIKGHTTILLHLYKPLPTIAGESVTSLLKRLQHANPRMQVCDGWLKYLGPVEGWISRFKQTRFYGDQIEDYTKLELCLLLPFHPTNASYPAALNRFLSERYVPLITGYTPPKAQPAINPTLFLILLITIFLGSLYSLSEYLPTFSTPRLSF